MKTDRELLGLAAKAAGIVGTWHERGQCIHVTDCAGMSDIWWRPLTDDGDALRLAVSLGMRISTDSGSSGCKMAEVLKGHGALAVESGRAELHGDDPYAATRRAIVRAAAVIGGSL